MSVCVTLAISMKYTSCKIFHFRMTIESEDLPTCIAYIMYLYHVFTYMYCLYQAGMLKFVNKFVILKKDFPITRPFTYTND